MKEKSLLNKTDRYFDFYKLETFYLDLMKSVIFVPEVYYLFRI